MIGSPTSPAIRLQVPIEAFLRGLVAVTGDEKDPRGAHLLHADARRRRPPSVQPPAPASTGTCPAASSTTSSHDAHRRLRSTSGSRRSCRTVPGSGFPPQSAGGPDGALAASSIEPSRAKGVTSAVPQPVQWGHSRSADSFLLPGALRPAGAPSAVAGGSRRGEVPLGKRKDC